MKKKSQILLSCLIGFFLFFLFFVIFITIFFLELFLFSLKFLSVHRGYFIKISKWNIMSVITVLIQAPVDINQVFLLLLFLALFFILSDFYLLDFLIWIKITWHFFHDVSNFCCSILVFLDFENSIVAQFCNFVVFVKFIK